VDPREAELLAALPTSAADAVRAAIAAAAAGDATAAWKHVVAAFVAMDFPKYPIASSPDMLTPVQRGLAELVAMRSDIPMVSGFAAPTERWVLRRWLRIDPPGPLERDVEFVRDGQPQRGPLWLALKSDPRAAERVDQLALAERLEIFGDVEVFAYSVRPNWQTPAPVMRPDLATLHDEGRTWAPRYADMLVANPRVRGWAPLDLVFVALARAKIPIEPRWDVLLPIALAKTAPDLFRECFEAIPFARRTAALAPHLGPKPPNFVFPLVIDRHPQPDLVDAQFATFKQYAERPNADVRALLEQIGARIPTLAPTIAKHLARKKVAKLLFEPVPLPSRDQLTPLLKKQLAWFERDGGDWNVLQLFVVRDAKGKHVYDATIHAGDDGKVFRVGTATKVADFAQGGAEARSEALMAALEQGLTDYERTRKKPT
jgi:hypothetical protein